MVCMGGQPEPVDVVLADVVNDLIECLVAGIDEREHSSQLCERGKAIGSTNPYYTFSIATDAIHGVAACVEMLEMEPGSSFCG